MTIAFDSNFASISPSTSGNNTISHTPSGTLKGILVLLARASSTDSVNSVTYGGVSLTEVTGSPLLYTGAETLGCYAYFLGTGVPSGTQDLVVNIGGYYNVPGLIIGFTGASDLEICDTTTLQGDGANPSGTLSLGSAVSCAVLAWGSGQNSASSVTPLSGWTERNPASQPTGTKTVGFHTYNTVSSSDVTFGITQSSDDYNILGVAVKEAAAGPTYTLTASNGSLALTGTASGLYSSRLLTAAQAALSLAGNATGLLAGRVVAASPGAFSLSGNAASLLAGRSLAATVGGFTYTGNAAGLTYMPLGGYSLAAETGSFSTIGNAAILNVSRLLGVSVGEFSVSGNTTYLYAGYTLAAETQGYTLTYKDAALIAPTKIVAETATFAVVGGDANLIYSGEKAAQGGGIGHGGFAKRRPRLIRIEEAENPEEVIAEIEAAVAESVKKPGRKPKTITVVEKPIVEPSIQPNQWIDYYEQQAQRTREQDQLNDLIAKAKLKIQQLQAEDTFRRIQEYEARMREEEELMLLLMAA